VKNKEHKRPKSSIAGWLSVLIVGVPALLQRIPKVQIWISNLALELDISSKLLNLLILLTLVVILTLFLSLLCIFKKEKTTIAKYINPKTIEKNPLSEQMIKIIKLLRDDNCLYSYQIKEQLSLSADELSYNIKTLSDEHFIKQLFDTSSRRQLSNKRFDYDYKWWLDHKGKEYLIINKANI